MAERISAEVAPSELGVLALVSGANRGKLLEDQGEVVHVEAGPQGAGLARALEQVAQQLGRSLTAGPHLRRGSERSRQRPA